MNRCGRNVTSTFVVLTVLLFFSGFNSAHAGLIDLNDFFADPTVTVSSDGSTATFTEDPWLTTVLLSNDPAGPWFPPDPEVIFAEIGGVGQILSFDFDFDEPGTLNDDQFGAFIIDAVTGDSVGTAFEFFTNVTSSGTVSFDLSSLSGTTSEPLGLQFQLNALAGDLDLDSELTISNVQLVPVPGAVLLAGLGLVTSAFGILRKKRKL